MSRLRTIDWSLFIAPVVLLVISTATIYTITYGTVGNKLAISQGVYALIGLVLLFAFSFLDYRQFRSQALILFAIGVVLLIPLLPFWSHKLPFVICEFNACRWINLGFFRLQISELIKLISIITLSFLLAHYYGKLTWWHLLLFIGIILFPSLLIAEQPDLGTAMVVVLTGFLLLLLGRFPLWIWIMLLVVAVVSAPLGYQMLKPYQKKRIEVFINPNLDPTRTGYNVRQAEIAVGSGGVFGSGFGQGSQSQLNFLPVAHTDFIFAGYAEATGYVGSLFLLGVYMFIIWRALHIAHLSKDVFGRFLAYGIAMLITIQVFINVGMNIRLLPVTGVPLPLVSYGGTSLFISMIAIGILQSITIRHKKITFS